MAPITHPPPDARGNVRPQANTHLPLTAAHPIQKTFHGWYFRRASSPGENASWTRYHKAPMAYSSDELGRMARHSLAATAKAKRPARSAAEQYRLLGDRKRDMVDALLEEVRRREGREGVVWVLACVTQDARAVVKRGWRGALVRAEEVRQVDVILKREEGLGDGLRSVRRDNSVVDAAVLVAGPVRAASPVDIDVTIGAAPAARQTPWPPLDSHVSRPTGILKASKPPAPVLPPYPTDEDGRGHYPSVFPAAVQPPPLVRVDSNDGYPPPPPTPPGARHAVPVTKAPESPRGRMPSPPYPASPPPILSAPVTSRAFAGQAEKTRQRANDRTRGPSAAMLDLVDTDSSESEVDLPPPPPPMPQPKSAKNSRSSRSAAYDGRAKPGKPARHLPQERVSASKHGSTNPNIINITVPHGPVPIPIHNRHTNSPQDQASRPRDRRRGRSRSRSRSRSVEALSRGSKRASSRSRSSSRRSSSTVSTRVRTILSSAASEGYSSPPSSASRSPRDERWVVRAEAGRRTSPRERNDGAFVPRREEERRRRWRRSSSRSRSRSRSRNRDVYHWASSSRHRSPSPSPRHARRYDHDNGVGALYAVNYGHDRRDYPPLPPPTQHGSAMLRSQPLVRSERYHTAHRGRPAPQMLALPVPAPLPPHGHSRPRLQTQLAPCEEWVWQVPPAGRASERSGGERSDARVNIVRGVARERPARRSRSRSGSRSRSRSRVTCVRRQRQRETRSRSRSRSRGGRDGEWVAYVGGEQGAVWPWGVSEQGQGQGRWRREDGMKGLRYFRGHRGA